MYVYIYFVPRSLRSLVTKYVVAEEVGQRFAKHHG